MADRYIVVKARSQNSGTRGRCISSAGGNHIVMDDADYHGGPNEAITAAEAFLSGITACGALMLERLAHEDDIPLQRIDVAIEATRDSEAAPEVHSVYDKVRMRFELAGPTEAQAHDLVETYKRR